MEYIIIIISAIFVNNIVLAQFLGICPFIGVSSKVETSVGMTGAVTFVMVIATIVTYLLQKYVLDAFGIAFMQTITFILVIAALVQLVEIILKKVSPALYQALGIFLPLITTNCAILGLALFSFNKGYGFVEGMVYALGAGGGVTLALVLFAGIREETRIMNIPNVIKGTAINLIIAGIMSMAFMGFAGLFSS